ncbi:polysaccharide biosynthesis/export family protein [Limimaricola sp.]|uniref:polysaccharide biosynthesis/export family protein n=1 Tax=Limimaricola sp. TaxID=2211665 RepID=UPI0040590046
MTLHAPRPGPRRGSRPLRALLIAVALLVAAPLLGPGFGLDPGGAARAQQAYRIQPGDSLRIEVIEDDALNRTVLVAPDGWITLPLAGSVQAGGRSVPQLQAALARALAANFASLPNVFVSLAARAERIAPVRPDPVTQDVYVLGEVATPGRIEIEPGTSVLQLLARVGGFTRFAASRRIQLRRVDAAGVERIYTLDYDAILQGRSPNGQALLTAGDVIVVPERGLFE